MLRIFARTLGLLLLAGGFAALIVDGTRSIGASSLRIARFADLCLYLFPNAYPQLQPAVERNLHPLVWNPFLNGFFAMPSWVVLIAFGLLLLWMAHRRRAGIGYSSRP
ncbi:MAG: hypothetical protein FJX29_03490 [Alphaproteobacteria bacterium]|nr:hypothetical protein [Alphaproteobacteria bacterium]